MTADNWYSYIELIDELAKRKLTYIGTMKKKSNVKYQADFSRKKIEMISPLCLVLQNKILCAHMSLRRI